MSFPSSSPWVTFSFLFVCLFQPALFAFGLDNEPEVLECKMYLSPQHWLDFSDYGLMDLEYRVLFIIIVLGLS